MTEEDLAQLAEAAKSQEEQIANKLTKAMAGLSKIGRYYKHHGYVPQFIAIDSPHAKRKAPKPMWRPDNRCGTCGKQFVAPTLERCQCRPQTKNDKGIKKGRRVHEIEVAP